MDRIRVKQGESIQERGIWFHQGAVLEVENPDRFRDAVELTDEPVNIPNGLFPEENAPEEKE